MTKSFMNNAFVETALKTVKLQEDRRCSFLFPLKVCKKLNVKLEDNPVKYVMTK